MTVEAGPERDLERAEESASGTGRFASLAHAAVARAGHPLSILALFSLAYLAMGLLYLDTARRAGATEERIAASRSALARQGPNLDQLQTVRSGWQYARETALSRRIDAASDAEILDRLVTLANVTGVRLFSAGIRPDIVELVEEEEYLGTPLLVKAHGSLSEVRVFLSALESGAVNSLEIRNAVVSENSGSYVVDVSAVVYSQIDPFSSSSDDQDQDDSSSAAETALNPRTAGGSQR